MPTKLRPAALALIAILMTASGPLTASPAAAQDCRTTCTDYGPPQALGQGTARTYVRVEHSRPVEIGAVVDAAALASLPYSPPTDEQHCVGTMCVGGYGLSLLLPPHAPTPYRWVLLNWNPAGHGPKGVFDVPHFDMHFYVTPRGTATAIRPGSCALLVACDQVAKIAKPLDQRYVPPGYPTTLPATAQVAMGEHLETHDGFQNGATFIYGAIGGRLAFLEPMVRLDALQNSAPGDDRRRCLPVAQPQAWQKAGWYPSEYCLGRSSAGDAEVSLDKLTFHDAG
ncbi:hypothetical protein [Catenulispora subtropica]|uniref:DUF5602 domain-containing protein n=1 Tax=Catenulispora subtropica TaxID=450798 RepID=A0ABP5CWM0_9ACTN